MKEIWKDIIGYECLYQISTIGNVKRLVPEKEIGKRGYSKNEHILSQCNVKGYLKVDLWKNNKRQAVSIHRMMAIAFIENPNNYPLINHKDENKSNNNLDNLEWCTHKYNINYKTVQQRKSKSNSKPVIQKTLDGIVVRTYASRVEAELETGISSSQISECAIGKQKYAHGFMWENA